jgi:acyl-CoA synthetase (AMP-forming)/AMP-acid ligase II
MVYIDLLHIYGVSRAGYIPQMFSLRLSSPEVIYELLNKAEAKALIYDLSYEPILNNSPVPTFLAVNAKSAVLDDNDDLPDIPIVSENDTAFVFHTSGSTSGSPKLVPWTHAWINFHFAKAGPSEMEAVPNSTRQSVGTW